MLNDREKLFELVKRAIIELDYGDAATQIADYLIANNVVVRKRAKWNNSGRYIFERGGKAICCTECGCALTEKEYAANHWNFCPNCGADMRGEEHESG